MTLTNGGRLGIGITLPTKELDVSGNATVSGSLDVQSLNVTNTITADLTGNVTGNVTGDLTGNVNATNGTSKFNHLDISGVSTFGNGKFSAIGFGQNAVSGKAINVFVNSINSVFVDTNGKVGIRTTESLPNLSINASQASASIGAVGVGITILASAVDLSQAGLTTSRHVILPRMDDSGRSQLLNVTAGSVIFNTQQNKMQFYDGTEWRNVTSTAA